MLVRFTKRQSGIPLEALTSTNREIVLDDLHLEDNEAEEFLNAREYNLLGKSYKYWYSFPRVERKSIGYYYPGVQDGPEEVNTPIIEIIVYEVEDES